MNKVKTLATLAGAGLATAVVVTEMRKPAESRTWEGSLGGFLPYDLRPPTAERFRDRMWAPDDEALLTPHAFGIGWSVNFGRIARKLGLA